MWTNTIFENISWFEMWGPLWLVFVIALGYMYHKYIVKHSEYNIGYGKKIPFYTGLILFYLLHGSPFSVIANHYLFSALTLQLSLTYFAVIPFLIIGTPYEWFKKYTWNHTLRLLINSVGHPWLTLVLFNMLFSIYFIPSVFNIVHASVILTFIVQTILFLYGFFMWWIIISPVPRLNKLSNFQRIAFTFIASALMMPIGFFLLVVLDAHYTVFIEAEGDIFPVITAVYDQQMAGGLLKFIQIISYVLAVYQILKHWVWSEEEEGVAYDKNYKTVQGIVIPIDKYRNKKKR